MSLHAVIMAGGSGTRLWPASRTNRPKQFLPFARGQALIQATIERLAGLCPAENVWVVTNRRQAGLLRRLMPEFPQDRVLVEPQARDTAPCIALATAAIGAREPDATMVVLPADHVVEPTAEFHRMVQRGEALAKDGETLVTFGSRPLHPETGYGYIECGAPLDGSTPRAFAVRHFREKPDLATAQGFLARGGFLWNSGIFVWTVGAIRSAMRHANQTLAGAADLMLDGIQRNKSAQVNRAFRVAPKTSIDYAVLEKAPKVAVVEATASWHDVGTFAAIAALGAADAEGNVALTSRGASQFALQSRDNLVYADGKRTVALFGVHDLVVVAVGDAVLVCPKDRAGDLKLLVEGLRVAGRQDIL